MRVLPTCALAVAVSSLSACGRTEQAPQPTAAALRATASPTPNPSIDLAYVCPMDRDIRSNSPGTCPRCGMDLVAGIPDQSEYPVAVDISPRPARVNEPVDVTFAVSDPWTGRPVEKFNIVHEKLFHAFFISRDLQFFVHDHPVWQNGAFRYRITFPKSGMYRVLGDFYPEAAAPQLVSDSIFVAGDDGPTPALSRDYTAKDAENMRVELVTSPEAPVAGLTTQMRMHVSPNEGLQKYLGAWGHMLAASDDLIDMIHTHPYIADGSADMQFSLVLPRSRVYRIWVQFQRNGVVNTAHFDVPVAAPTTP